MQNTDELTVQQILDFDVQQLETADACAEQLKLAATEASKMAASAVGYGQMAIRYAIKAGAIMNKATGILPEPEPKVEGGESEKEKPPFVLSFKTQYRQPSEWSRDSARDFLYEFERLAKLASILKTEFGL
jgi:hypothetical protein